jgi:hypothetical protein
MHSYHCKGLTEDENKFAGTCVEAMEKQKQLKALGETSGTSGSDNSQTSSAGNKRRAGVQSGALDNHVVVSCEDLQVDRLRKRRK